MAARRLVGRGAGIRAGRPSARHTSLIPSSGIAARASRNCRYVGMRAAQSASTIWGAAFQRQPQHCGHVAPEPHREYLDVFPSLLLHTQLAAHPTLHRLEAGFGYRAKRRRSRTRPYRLDASLLQQV